MQQVIKKTWTINSGKQVTCTGVLLLTQISHSDNIELRSCKINIDVVVEEYGSQGSTYIDLRRIPGSQFAEYMALGYTHIIGGLMLLPEHVDIIKSVKSELEAHPAWIEYQAKKAKERGDSEAN